MNAHLIDRQGQEVAVVGIPTEHPAQPTVTHQGRAFYFVTAQTNGDAYYHEISMGESAATPPPRLLGTPVLCMVPPLGVDEWDELEECDSEAAREMKERMAEYRPKRRQRRH